jgi:hypothetical protein
MTVIMVWIFGLALASDKTLFIYDVEYDFKRLVAQGGAGLEGTLYCINPAFIDGLMN